MNRRTAIRLLLTGCALPLSTLAQGLKKPYRIAWLGLGTPTDNGYQLQAFKRGLAQLGYAEELDYSLDIQWALGRTGLLNELAKDLVGRDPNVIVVGASSATKAAQQATSTIPIVMAAVGDPVGSGFAKSLARPGSNITGLSILTLDLSPKLLELLVATVPKLSKIAVLWNPSVPFTAKVLKNIQASIQDKKLDVKQYGAANSDEISKAVNNMRRDKVGALIVASDAFLHLQRKQIAALCLENRIPTIFAFREAVEVGGLMSYGQNISDWYRRTAVYVDKIIKGESPANMAIEQPMSLEFVINLQTAKELGLKIPETILLRADQLIQ